MRRRTGRRRPPAALFPSRLDHFLRGIFRKGETRGRREKAEGSHYSTQWEATEVQTTLRASRGEGGFPPAVLTASSGGYLRKVLSEARPFGGRPSPSHRERLRPGGRGREVKIIRTYTQAVVNDAPSRALCCFPCFYVFLVTHNFFVR